MRLFKKIITISTLFALGTIALSGCSGDKNSNSNNATSELNNSSGEKTYGGTVVVGIQQDLDSLDPHLVEAAGTREVLFNVYEGLVKPTPEGDLIPAVASDVTVSEDATEYVFTLRDGILFHNGNLVTVEDIEYSLKRCAGMLEGQSAPLTSAYSAFASVEIVDEKTVKVTLSQPDSEMLAYMTTAIIPKDSDKTGELSGTGPFQFVSYSPLESYIVEKNQNYWSEENAAYLDRVEFKVIADSNLAVTQLKSGTIQVYPYMTDDQALSVENDMQVLAGHMNLVQALYLNNEAGPLSDVKVRQAICYALNKEEINLMVAGGRGTEISTSMFSGFEKYYNKDLDSVYSYNIEKAKSLLTEAGYENGFDLTITVPSNYQFHMDTAQVIVEQLKAAGINATIEPIEWESWLEEVYVGRNYEATVIGLDANMSPKDILYRFETGNSKNFINFSSPAFDEAFQKAVATTNDEEKVTYYKEAQAALTNEAATAYIMDPPLLVALDNNLAGYTFYPLYVMDMAKVYYVK